MYCITDHIVESPIIALQSYNTVTSFQSEKKQRQNPLMLIFLDKIFARFYVLFSYL